MKKLLFVSLVLAITMAACGNIQPNVEPKFGYGLSGKYAGEYYAVLTTGRGQFGSFTEEQVGTINTCVTDGSATKELSLDSLEGKYEWVRWGNTADYCLQRITK